jgi:hypothetical protein
MTAAPTTRPPVALTPTARVIREWRTGGEHVLPLDAAVETLLSHGLPEVRRLGEAGIRRALAAGETLFTERSSFRHAPAVVEEGRS